MTMYTARFSERWELLNHYYGTGVGANTENNTGWADVGRYKRLAIIVHPLSLNDDLNIDVEEAQDTSGTNVQDMDGGGKNTTVATGDTAPTVIEVKGEEFDVADRMRAIQVEMTTADTAGGSNYFAVEIWGETSFPPADASNLESVVD